MSTDLARRTPDDICTEINACSTKLAQAEKKVEDWNDTRRCLLRELKDKYPDLWLKEVKEKCNIGRAMAYRILQLPSPGKEKSRENNGSRVLLVDKRNIFRRKGPSTRKSGRATLLFACLARPRKPRKSWRPTRFCWSSSFLEQYQIDLQLTRAALIRMLTSRPKAHVVEGDATAEKSPSAKKRGRPPGSKNKPKEAAVPEPATATDAPAAPTTTALGNGVDPADSAKERAAYYDDDLSNPNHPLHRSVPDQAVQP